MTARLIAVAGPLEGATFPLPEGDFTIGRDTDNALCVPADDRGLEAARCHPGTESAVHPSRSDRPQPHLREPDAGARTSPRARRRNPDRPLGLRLLDRRTARAADRSDGRSGRRSAGSGIGQDGASGGMPCISIATGDKGAGGRRVAAVGGDRLEEQRELARGGRPIGRLLAATACASRSNRASRSGIAPASAGITLTATSRPSRVSRAR